MAFAVVITVVEAQEKATQARLRELNKAGGLYQDRLGLQFKNIGGRTLIP